MRYPADRNPMSEARRQHVHGPLVPEDGPDWFNRACITVILAIFIAAIIVATKP